MCVGDGLIKFNELKEVLKACTEENGMKFTDEHLDQLTQALFDDAITNSTGASEDVEGIQYEQLKAQLVKHPGLLENLSKRSTRIYIVVPAVCLLSCEHN